MGPIFNCKFPWKVLRDLFRPPFVPDPEFTAFDLKALRGEDPEGSRAAFGGFIAGELNKINNEGPASAPETENDAGGPGTVVIIDTAVSDNNGDTIAPQPPFP
jgi:hypothetical protein